jgi:hypothetical protein
MKKVLASLVLAFLTACASVPSVNGQLQTGYQTVSAYIDQAKNGLARGRISVAQAEQASSNAKKARDTLDKAKTALTACQEKLPCTDYTNLLQNLQPSLLEFELELRKQQGQVK